MNSYVESIYRRFAGISGFDGRNSWICSPPELAEMPPAVENNGTFGPRKLNCYWKRAAHVLNGMAQASEPRDIELLRWLAAGDESAFVSFYRRYQAPLYRFALHITGKPETAADVVQETFLALMRDASRFDAARGTPAAFLFGIARNHIHRVFEKESRFVPLADLDAAAHSGNGNGNGNSNGHGVHGSAHLVEFDPAASALEENDAARQLRAAILTLPEHYREVVTLCDLEGRTYDETAQLLDCPVGTVRSRLNRARDVLMQKLGSRSARQQFDSKLDRGKPVRSTGR
jgi:RNA polymerase sigma-70 factor, ECF subfamily